MEEEVERRTGEDGLFAAVSWGIWRASWTARLGGGSERGAGREGEEGEGGET